MSNFIKRLTGLNILLNDLFQTQPIIKSKLGRFLLCFTQFQKAKQRSVKISQIQMNQGWNSRSGVSEKPDSFFFLYFFSDIVKHWSDCLCQKTMPGNDIAACLFFSLRVPLWHVFPCIPVFDRGNEPRNMKNWVICLTSLTRLALGFGQFFCQFDRDREATVMEMWQLYNQKPKMMLEGPFEMTDNIFF